MKDLIEALTILMKYQKPTRCPTHCEHDIMMVKVDEEVSQEDKDRLDNLSFNYNEDHDCYTSYRFGSA